tara:strand:- start:58 stop:720 length:663 start_codon:yes stop_codon:yes gene_type:complete
MAERQKKIKKFDSIYEKEASVEIRNHRGYIGGMWEIIGKLQFDFIIEQGLNKSHKFIDVGCGSLRGGLHFIDYLDANKYYGLDINKSLILSGIKNELSETSKDKITFENNFTVNDNFDFPFDIKFDYGIGLSIFTHLSHPKIIKCLKKLNEVFNDNGKFYATVFLPNSSVVHTYPDKDPYHYTVDEILNLGSTTNWTVDFIGEFGHPRQQQMVKFTKNKK